MSSPLLAVGPLKSDVLCVCSVCFLSVDMQCISIIYIIILYIYYVVSRDCVLLDKMAVFRAQTAKFPVSFRIDPWAAQSTSSL